MTPREWADIIMPRLIKSGGNDVELVAQIIQLAVREECRRCAMICESFADYPPHLGREYAAAIRLELRVPRKHRESLLHR